MAGSDLGIRPMFALPALQHQSLHRRYSRCRQSSTAPAAWCHMLQHDLWCTAAPLIVSAETDCTVLALIDNAGA